MPLEIVRAGDHWSQDIPAGATVGIDVWVINASGEVHLPEQILYGLTHCLFSLAYALVSSLNKTCHFAAAVVSPRCSPMS
jgi:hypothetical protein